MINPQDSGLLLVEDNQNDVLLFQRALRKAGANVPLNIVKDGEQAVHYLSGKSHYADRNQYPLPMLIFMDIHLPKKSGLEVLEWLKQQPTLRRTPVIVFTSSEAEGDIDQAYDNGANSYVIKPASFKALEDIVVSVKEFWIEKNCYSYAVS